MRGSGPRAARRRRPPGGGGDTPGPCTSLAGCCSAPRRAPLWTCLLLCAALRTLLASPSNEGRAMGVGTAATRGDPRRRFEAGPGSVGRGAPDSGPRTAPYHACPPCALLGPRVLLCQSQATVLFDMRYGARGNRPTQ